MAARRFLPELALLLLALGVGYTQNNPQLRGTIEDQSGAPIAKVAVTLISVDRALQTQSGENGVFQFGKVPAGAYELQITSPGFKRQELPVTITHDLASPSLEVILTIGSVPDPETCGRSLSVRYGTPEISKPLLTGRIRSWDQNKAVAHAKVTLQSAGEDGHRYRSNSDRAGNFAFGNLSAGRYDVRISSRGYFPAQVQHIVVPQMNEVSIDTTLLRRNTMLACQ